MTHLVLKYLHVLGAVVLIGTGTGIAFFLVAAHTTGKASRIAGVARIVVTADFLFTATAVIAQPVTGVLLAREMGYHLLEGWIVLSIVLYVVIGLLWLPVVVLQMGIRDIAEAAEAAGAPLPSRYYWLFWSWFVFGFPAFGAILAILWLMIARPSVELPWIG
ncbi:DUF2269 domain-containing protein [Phreatobacter sp.]|uniref:DUF2269 family protein n=1 Tax=Phreatobacter sp. TaxID=1966341 RepID=UPI0025FA78C9|nr:DUF2269 domain-containing protein [Phreatobacter sp.]